MPNKTIKLDSLTHPLDVSVNYGVVLHENNIVTIRELIVDTNVTIAASGNITCTAVIANYVDPGSLHISDDPNPGTYSYVSVKPSMTTVSQIALSSPYTITNPTPHVFSNSATFNGNVVLGNASTDTVTLTSAMSGDGVNITGMPGEIRMYGGSSAPTGWLLCDGASINSVTYAKLHAIITNNYGGNAYVAGVTDQGAGVSFNLPNLKGRVPMGTGTGADGANSATGNAPSGNPLTARNIGAFGGTESETLSQFQNTNSGTTNTWNASGSGTINNTQPFLAVSFIIKT